MESCMGWKCREVWGGKKWRGCLKKCSNREGEGHTIVETGVQRIGKILCRIKSWKIF